MHKPQRKASTVSRRQRVCTDFVCRVDYLPERMYRRFVKLPGAYRLYKWCEKHQY